ncbi:MAG: Flp pilus assembly complex ATPase component TadA [Magnetococcales bacterium]|nr:Flp pilus assembly complex ATPase component TadA [Magnetococcales bacterium]MBF0438429.1 Flp pilus assembly complex ATPase component TadA [Magnetococcales bacterium]
MQNECDIRLGEALVALKFLTKEQIDEFLNAQKSVKRIGDQLVWDGRITRDQLDAVLAEQKRSHTRFGEVLINMGIMPEREFCSYLAASLNVPFLDLDAISVDEKVVKSLNEATSLRLRAVPLYLEGNSVMVGMVDPTDIMAVDELSQILRRPVRLALVMERQVQSLMNTVYKKGTEIHGLVQELGDEITRKQVDFNQFIDQEMKVDPPVVRILRSLFQDAIANRVSDIHIEPGKDVLRIRKRVDGELQETVMREKHIAPPLVSKLKLMSGLDISERRRPQDGRFSLKVNEVDVDVRLSILPVAYGEAAVLRLLIQKSGSVQLSQMGFPELQLNRLRSWIRHPHGLLLVVGPTGSGKTTTLYGILNDLNQSSKKIITVEDPVEYRLDRVNQVQVNARIDLTFATILRTVLRQDPDIIMVGEMRDQETIDVAIRAALTGHLVLSTLHTNDAPSTAIRLMEMGAKGFAVASSLIGVLSQRLVRRVCKACAIPYKPTIQEVAWLESMGEAEFGMDGLIMGTGCKLCGNSGYTGRISVGELLEIDSQLAKHLRQNDTETFLKESLLHPEYRPVHVTAVRYARDGLTTLREAMRLGGDNASGSIGD